ncbi:MAG: SpoIIE family protein phosphatase [Candidatus Riflebacteria bacterium]|nr:SpoIIE family protein phosphatase [Candidatus Riflebacteria bacterium]
MVSEKQENKQIVGNSFYSIGFLKLLASIFMLVGFPLFVVDAAINYTLSLREKNQLSATFKKLDDRLTELQPWGEPERFFKKSLRNLISLALQGSNPVRLLQKAIFIIQKRHPLLFDFTIFDENDRMVLKTNSKDSPFLAGKLLSQMRRFFTESTLFDENYIKLFASYLGIFQQGYQEPLLTNSYWFNCSSGPKKSWFFYFIHEKLSMFVNINKQGYVPMMALARLVKLPVRKDIKLALVNMNSMDILGNLSKKFRPEIERVAAMFENEPQNHFRLNGNIFSVLLLDQDFRLVAYTPDVWAKYSQNIMKTWRIFALFILVISIIISVSLIHKRNSLYISIRLKLLFLFLASSGLPLLILFFTGGAYLLEMKTALIQDAWQNSAELLRLFDSKILVMSRLTKKAFKDALRAADFSTNDGVQKFFNEMKIKVKKMKSETIKLFHYGGDILFDTEPSQGKSSDQLFNKLYQNILDFHNSQYEGVVRANAPDFVSAELYFNTIFGMSLRAFVDTIAVGQKVVPIQIGPLTISVYTDFVSRNDGLLTHMFLVKWSELDFQRFYISSAFPRKPLEDGTRLIAIQNAHSWTRIPRPKDVSSRRGPIFRKTLKVIPSVKFSKKTVSFVSQVLRTRRLGFDFTERENENENEQFILSGMPGLNLKDFTLFAVKPMKTIEIEISQLRFRLLLFGFFSIAFTLTLGLFLAKKVLEPVRELSRGIAAVANKDFFHRVPSQDRDELGDLSNLFNNMMENLEETTLGRNVQRELFPSEILEHGEFRVFGYSRPASQLGGDYFDYFKVDEEHSLVVIGDVTGHGTPSALVMAMAKAIIYTYREGKNSIESILQTLNRVIFSSTKGKLNMTFAAFLLNTGNHSIEFYNCGHLYPFRISAGKTTMVKGLGFLLGIKSEIKLRPVNFFIDNGERLILYTDGLVESFYDVCKGKGEFEHFQKHLESTQETGIREYCKTIIENHPYLRSLPENTSQIDDFTVVIIERKALT